MKKSLLIIVIQAFLVTVLSAGDIESARRLTGIARSLWSPVELQGKGLVNSTITKEQIDKQVRQAVIWLEAADRLGGNEKNVLSDLEYLYRSEMVDDPGRAMKALTRYSQLQPDDDLCVAGWLDYSLDKLDQQGQREKYIHSMLENLQEYPRVQSDMITLLGVYAAQQGQTGKASAFFEYAWKVWPYNLDAGAKLLAIPQLEQSELDSSLSDDDKAALIAKDRQNNLFRSLYYLVMSVQSNPADFQSVLDLADLLFGLNKYEQAMLCYGHCLALLKADDTKTSPEVLAGLRFKQAVSAYNSANYQQCQQILSEILQASPEDIPSAAFMVMVLKKQSEKGKADEFSQAFLDRLGKRTVVPELERQSNLDLAWFYAFAMDDNAKALEYTQKAGPDADGKLSSLNGYLEVATAAISAPVTFSEKYKQADPLTYYALANLYAGSGQFDQAYKNCDIAINSSPGVMYLRIKETLSQLRKQAGLTEPTMQQDIVDVMAGRLDAGQMALALTPEKFFRSNIRPSRKLYEYNEDIALDISVTNISSYELLLGQQAFFDPYIYYQASITAKTPGVKAEPVIIPLGLRYLAQKPLLRPGFANSVQEVIDAGPLGDTLDISPQMEYEISFSCLPMPVVGPDGLLKAACPALVQSSEPVVRSAFVLTPQKLSINYNLLQNGRDDERVQAVRLFTGLLKEAAAARDGKLAYKPKTIDYDKTITAILANLKAESAQVRAWTAWSLDGLLGDKKVVNALSACLKDTDWFVRLMVLNTLYKSVKIDTVLDWFSKNETDPTVLRQIELWLVKPWTPEPLPYK